MNTNKPTVTEADRKCAESVLKKCVYQAGDTDPEAAAAVIAAHREASNAELQKENEPLKQQLVGAVPEEKLRSANITIGELLADLASVRADLDAAVERAERYAELLRIAANNAHDSGEDDSFEDLINAALAASEQREGRR